MIELARRIRAVTEPAQQTKAIFPIIESPTGESHVGRDLEYLDFTKDREGGLERLRSELTRIALNARGGFHWDNTRPAFPGLLAFDEADAAIYFGGDDDIRGLIERLNARRVQGGPKLVALLGASGSGKSSLLRAGVLPRLKRDRDNWIVLPPFRPESIPSQLAQALATAFGPNGNWRKWREALGAEDTERSLSDLGRDLCAVHAANEAQILLSIDQGEELFGTADRPEAEQFFKVLNTALDERLPFIGLLAPRSDYLGQLSQAEATALFDDFVLKPMPLDRMRDIIEGPARVAGLIDDKLVAAAMKDAVTEDALPLLAFALREMYDRFGTSGRLTVDEYQAFGDDDLGLSPLENAVRRKADEVLEEAKPNAGELATLEDAFVLGMVRVNAEGEYARRPTRIGAFRGVCGR